MPISDETRILLFDKLKTALQAFAPPFVVYQEKNHVQYELIGNKKVPYGYDKKIIPGMFFASIAQRKDSVTFHFFPVYMNEKMLSSIPSLAKQLKGKTCFHFKKLEQINETELQSMLHAGQLAWEKAGYLEC